MTRKSIRYIVQSRKEFPGCSSIQGTLVCVLFQDTLSICLDTTAQVKVPPTVFEVIEGRGSLLPFRDITPEDLLGRQSVQIDHAACRRLLADKVRHLRIFDDQAGQLNLAVSDVGGSILAVSAFTLLGDARKGRRPSYAAAAGPEQAKPLYDLFCDTLESAGLAVLRGVFRAYMEVTSTNDGPVCILLDSRKGF